MSVGMNPSNRQKHGHVYRSVRGEAAVDVNTMINCLNESGFSRMLFDCTMVANKGESVTDSQELLQIAGTNVTFSDYVDCESSIFAFQQSSLKEILEQHQEDANLEDNNDDDDKEQEVLPILTLTAALGTMALLLQF
ncbi:hypothetical protein T11_12797 [Trichinella zimbabwensis]|nr:hypothetical protein T11_12797 [Trichinella zimbabwensis]